MLDFSNDKGTSKERENYWFSNWSDWTGSFISLKF